MAKDVFPLTATGIPQLPATSADLAEVAGISFEELLSYHRRRIDDPLALRRIEAAFNENELVRAHLHSLRYLDLERPAALQDAIDLEQFDVAKAAPLCRQVASTDGTVFEQAASHAARQEWARHTKTCVFCRRMRRQVFARAEARRAGLPEGQRLLLNWLLDHHTSGLLASIRDQLVPKTRLAASWKDFPAPERAMAAAQSGSMFRRRWHSPNKNALALLMVAPPSSPPLPVRMEFKGASGGVTLAGVKAVIGPDGYADFEHSALWQAMQAEVPLSLAVEDQEWEPVEE